MPCEGGPSSAQVQQEKQMLQEEKKQIDRLTQDLCYLCATLKDSGLLKKYASPRILTWHKQHMKNDEAHVLRKMRQFVKSNPVYTREALASVFIKRAERVHPVSVFHYTWFRTIAEMVMNEHEAKLQQTQNKKQLVEQAKNRLTPEEWQAINER